MPPTKPSRALDALSSGRISLDLPQDLPLEEWCNIGAQLGRAGSQLNWLIGDWWAFGEAHYGERKAIVEADDWTGPAFQTCMNVASVSRAFPTSRRREALSFKHHAEVAALPASEADELLDWCLEGMAERGRPRSSGDLRLKVEEVRQKKERDWWKRRFGHVPSTRFKISYAPQSPDKPDDQVIHIEVSRPASPPGSLAAPRPEIALDTSGADGSISSELAELKEEPLPELDRVKLAYAAFDALPSDLRLEVLRDCAAELGFRLVAEEKTASRGAKSDRSSTHLTA